MGIGTGSEGCGGGVGRGVGDAGTVGKAGVEVKKPTEANRVEVISVEGGRSGEGWRGEVEVEEGSSDQAENLAMETGSEVVDGCYEHENSRDSGGGSEGVEAKERDGGGSSSSTDKHFSVVTTGAAQEGELPVTVRNIAGWNASGSMDECVVEVVMRDEAGRGGWCGRGAGPGGELREVGQSRVLEVSDGEGREGGGRRWQSADEGTEGYLAGKEAKLVGDFMCSDPGSREVLLEAGEG
ncbi:hypothetical protein BV20DRAFT_979566 [Pilatotrama ljubarskyi]|nr:hypothetical protein BV20DRAFT_979566 [Pilatotrama ljubarskyi]